MNTKKIQNLKNQAISSILEAENNQELEALRIAYLGRKGELTKIIKQIPKLPLEKRFETGRLANEAKKAITEAIISRQSVISNQKSIKKTDWVDVTHPGYPVKIGHLHPTTHVINQMFEIFKHLGFSIAEGPEIETDEYNFEILNLPKDHPARALQDTLFIKEPEILLRSHTSSIEARVLASYKPPYRVVAAGKCYRYENVNASNNAVFYQFQGFGVQKGLSMADLKGMLFYFVREFLGKDRKIRFRCKYYPEVEPCGGLDVDCPFCQQKGCSVCKGRGWLELLGCGMIHPNILRNFNYDPNKISGFAFGMGLDRIVMDHFNINDIRSLYNGDIRYDLS
jgi:phenylalanyl-tRNA synthetase alpha chain